MKTKKPEKPKSLYRATYVETRTFEFFVEATTRQEGEDVASDVATSLQAAARFYVGNCQTEACLQDFELVPEALAVITRPENMIVFPGSVCLKKM